MKININLKMDTNVLIFSILVMICFILSLFAFEDGHLIEVQQYQNCTVPDYLNYQPYWETTGTYTIQEHKECCYPTECYDNIEDIPQDCDCIYPVACGTLEELGLG